MGSELKVLIKKGLRILDSTSQSGNRLEGPYLKVRLESELHTGIKRRR